MAQDYGIIISQPGVGVAGAKPNQILLNTSMPMFKIDTQAQYGFTTFFFQFINDTPNPPSGGNVTTNVYKFKHGYTYAPAIEALFYVVTPPTNAQGGYDLTQDLIPLSDNCYFYATWDSTWVYLNIYKYSEAFTPDALLTGTTVQISMHIFVEDVGGS